MIQGKGTEIRTRAAQLKANDNDQYKWKKYFTAHYNDHCNINAVSLKMLD